MNDTYIPAPVNLEGEELAPDLTELMEEIAENVHEVWAEGRIRAGWTYGPVRDDAKKQTPCLVPYAQLPEEEKEYDRQTARATLLLIQKKGYTIRKNT